MEKIVWDQSFSVGVQKIDKQHKKLIDMINQLIDAENPSVRSEAVSDTLMDMTDYATYHFQAEEELMQEYQYPHLDRHHLQHMDFIRKTAELATDTVELQQTVPAELLSFLKNWLVSHILESDMRYKDFFYTKGGS